MEQKKVIEVMNEAMIETKKATNEDYEINLKIQKYLKDDAIFFKIPKEKAYKILEKVGGNKETYQKLTSSKEYYELINKGKINAEDKNLIIKYEQYRKRKFI